MADGQLPSSEPESHSSSNNSSTNHSRSQSAHGRAGQKTHKVKFIGDEDGGGGEQGESSRRRSIPEIRLAESEDVADSPMTPTESEYAGRADVAAAQAQSRASRLAFRLSNSQTQTGRGKTNSGSNTPLIPNQQGSCTTAPITTRIGMPASFGRFVLTLQSTRLCFTRQLTAHETIERLACRRRRYSSDLPFQRQTTIYYPRRYD